jgi:DNA polymerase iota
LHKLQLIREAKQVCPDVVIVLGEDLTRFRDASKDLYNFLRQSVWSGKVERLGFDEVWYVLHDRLRYRPKWLRMAID